MKLIILLKKIFSTFLLLLIFTLTTSYSQDKNCDTIARYTEIQPKFKSETSNLDKYFNNHIVPVLLRSMERDNVLITKLHIILTINLEGEVIEATFSKSKLNTLCKKELREAFLTMKGWQPGILNNQAVCSYYSWPINSIKWQ
ncbi:MULTISPECIES: hypothetical protein [Flavobacterium]|uniref:TonB C-terminal domain-containing protein n=1 Tax=Flavobacterium jumunjinense TaxID=998845 RepID=A0ABV5GM82_9FLAO|nr:MULTISPECIES: hypothetical protein [Flavobacterium]